MFSLIFNWQNRLKTQKYGIVEGEEPGMPTWERLNWWNCVNSKRHQYLDSMTFKPSDIRHIVPWNILEYSQYWSFQVNPYFPLFIHIPLSFAAESLQFRWLCQYSLTVFQNRVWFRKELIAILVCESEWFKWLGFNDVGKLAKDRDQKWFKTVQ